MRRARFHEARFTGVCLLCAALLTAGGLVVKAGQEAPTEEEYPALMTEIRLTVSDAELHVDAYYWPEFGEDLDRLLLMFRQIEAFWEARGNDQAVGFAGEAIAKLGEMSAAGSAQDRGAAGSAIAALRSVCASCHENFREETADGYRIKPGS